MVEAYTSEFEQLFTHCIASGCGRCTPACVADVTTEGPYEVGDATVRTFFSPSDDALVALRGPAISERRATPDESCGAGTDCLCRPSGSGYRCDYCGQDGDWGLIGEASERVLVSAYAITDACLTLALSRGAARGVETTLIADKVNAGSPYSMDGRACAMGVPTYVTQWAGGSQNARNHHKLVVVDDVVVSGSMNFSASAVSRNHENTLVIEEARLADTAADFLRGEAALLEDMGVDPDCSASASR